MGAYNYISTIHPAAKGLSRTPCQPFECQSFEYHSFEFCKSFEFCNSFEFCQPFNFLPEYAASFSPAFSTVFLSASATALLPEPAAGSSPGSGDGVYLEPADGVSKGSPSSATSPDSFSERAVARFLLNPALFCSRSTRASSCSAYSRGSSCSENRSGRSHLSVNATGSPFSLDVGCSGLPLADGDRSSLRMVKVSDSHVTRAVDKRTFRDQHQRRSGSQQDSRSGSQQDSTSGRHQERCAVLRSYGMDSTGEFAVPCGASADFFCEDCGWVCELCARCCARSDHKLRELGDDLQNGAQAEIGVESEMAVASQIGIESETVVASQTGVASFIGTPSEIGVDSGLLAPEVRDEAGPGGLR